MNTSAHMQVIETGDFAGEVKPVIHPITDSRQLFDVYRLTYECYVAREPHLTSLDGVWIPHPDFDHLAETTILVAELDGEVVGTVTVILDGKQGLPLDEQFFNTCMLMRSARRPLAQVWRLLVKDSYPLKQTILTSLVAEATHHLLSRGIQTSLFLIQEEHATLCRELINGVTLTRTKSARGLSNACSVLMRTEAGNLKCDMHADTRGPCD